MIHASIDIPITVRHNRTEVEYYRSIVFMRPAEFEYESGDWIDIAFEEPGLQGGRTYSLSSSPTEPDLMITFRDGISAIKRRLAAMAPGDSLTITQYGNDFAFRLRPHRAATLIAGGVGIAPFRSMLKEMSDTGNRDPVRLIYLNKSPLFLFNEELEGIAESLPNVSIVRISTAEIQRKVRTKRLLDAIINLDGIFYIAGPDAMVEATEHLLIERGVDLKDIRIDNFGHKV